MLHIALGCNFCYLIAMRPAVTAIVRRLDRSLTFTSRLDLVIYGRDLFFELRNLCLGSLEFLGKLGIGRIQCGHGSAI
jgi:hypothetical protein